MTTTLSIADILADRQLFAQHFIIIADKQGNRVPLIYNRAQQWIKDHLTGRDVILKPRQMGSTTYFAADSFYDCVTRENINIDLMSHKGELSERILNRTRMMYEWWPIPQSKKPELSHDAAGQMYLKSRNNRFFIDTAGARVSGRGDTIHKLICSELAFWQDAYPDARKIFEAAEQSVPFDGEIYLESTPNGEGKPENPNIFYEKVQEALSGQSYWNLIQIPWWFVPEYTIPRGSGMALPNDRAKLTYTTEESDLIRRAGWESKEAEDRVRFRRRKLQELKGMFYQEYFEDLDSCFSVGGESFYDFDETERLRSGCYEAPHNLAGAEVWYLPQSEIDYPTRKQWKNLATAQELDDAVYVISVDPGQGKKTRSVALVWRMDVDNYERIRHEATLAGFWEPAVFAPMVKQLGYLYNNARIVPEANGHGMSFCAQIADYPNVFYRTDTVSGIMGKQIGWKTTGPTRLGASGSKMFAISELQSLINQARVITHDINLVRELRSWRYAGTDIETNSSDDYHDAAMIMAATRQTANHHVLGFIGRAGYNW